MSDRLGQSLHDRATRGEELSPEEQGQLDAWYAELDRAEAADLKSAPAGSETPLSAKIEKTLAEIAKVTQRIQELDRQTREVEQQNADLRLRLGHDSGSWNRAIRGLVESGEVVRKGEKRGARYRWWEHQEKLLS